MKIVTLQVLDDHHIEVEFQDTSRLRISTGTSNANNAKVEGNGDRVRLTDGTVYTSAILYAQRRFLDG